MAVGGAGTGLRKHLDASVAQAALARQTSASSLADELRARFDNGLALPIVRRFCLRVGSLFVLSRSVDAPPPR